MRVALKPYIEKTAATFATAILVAVFCILGGVSPVSAATTVPSTISSNTTWNTAGSPYVVTSNGVTINSGVTLTIDAGVIVKFNGTSSQMNVLGNIDVNGTSGNKVYFTSYRDDVGGDTNGNGSAAPAAAARDWDALYFPAGSAASSIEHAVIRYGGYFWNNSGSDACVFANGGEVTLSDSDVSLCGLNYGGIRVASGSIVTVNDTSFGSGMPYGIRVTGGTLSVDDSSFSGAAQYGLYATAGTITLTDSTFSGNTVGAAFVKPAVVFTHSGNTASGVQSGIRVDGTFSANRTWTADGLPYVTSGIVVSGVTLTVEPDVVVKFLNTGSYLSVSSGGVLDVNGTTADPVYFTSYLDDSAGGNTNGAGGTAAARDWDALRFPSGTGTLDGVVIRYGGYYWSSAGSATCVLVNGGSVTLTDAAVSDCSTNYGGILLTSGSATAISTTFSNQPYGIYATGGNLTVTDSTFTGNTVAAARVSMAVAFTHSGNTATGVQSAFRMEGTMTANRTWTADGMPYLVKDNLYIASGATLSVSAGAVVKFLNTGASLGVNSGGTLDVNGTMFDPVYFTSYKDDDEGGDTNGDGDSSGAVGDWGNISFSSGSTGTFSGTYVGYGGYSATVDNRYMVYNNGGALDFEDIFMYQSHAQGYRQDSGSADFDRAAIYDQVYGMRITGGSLSMSAGIIVSNAVGAKVSGGTVFINDSYIDSNSSYGIEASVTVDATFNYWGDATGPFPLGSGDAITTDVGAADHRTESWLVVGEPSVDGTDYTLDWDGATTYSTEWADAVSYWNTLNPVEVAAAVSDAELTLEDIDTGVMGYCGIYFTGPDIILFSIGDMEGTACSSHKTRVAKHELGHAIGLAHSFEDAIMTGSIPLGSDDFSATDLFVYRAMWGY